MALLSETSVRMQLSEIAAILGLDLPEGTDAGAFAEGFSTDTRSIAAGNCFIALKGASFNGNEYAKQAAEQGASCCILSEQPPEQPDIPCFFVPDTEKAYAALANAYITALKAAGTKVIAVTGSSGKTTVKDMTAHVLAAKYNTYATSGNHNNHIGVPYTLLHMPADTECAVIEMGMNHAGEISYLSKIAAPDYAVITNIGTAHIGNLGSQENIFRAKLEVLEGMESGSEKLILPVDDAFLAKRDDIAAAEIHYSSRLGAAAELTASDITETADDTQFTVHYGGESAAVTLPMTGLHNVTDALLAMHTGLCCGMTLAEAAAALADFVPGAMRSERVTIGKHTVIRDYYNANPEAAAAALEGLQVIAGTQKRVAVLGNMNELGDYAADRHRALGERCKTHTDAAFFCGVNYRDFAEGYGGDAAAFETQDKLTEALLAFAREHAETPCCYLVKGSRGLHMEKSCEALEETLNNL